MSQVLEFRSKNWLRNLPELTDTETKVVKDALNSPAVIKYLNLVAFRAIADFRLTPAVESAQNVNTLIAQESFTKGVISVVDTLLTYLDAVKE